MVRKRESRKKIEDLYDSKDMEMEEEQSKNVYRNMAVERRDLEAIRRDLEGELPELPVKKKVDKENNGYFDVEKKHVVIGEQLPKMYLMFNSDSKNLRQRSARTQRRRTRTPS